MKYLVSIEEVLRKEVEVEAASSEEAERKVRKAYQAADIVLSGDDFAYSDIEVITKL